MAAIQAALIEVDDVEVVDHSHEAALVVFDELYKALPGYDHFRALMQMGWKWRQAAYIAWASVSPKEREPETLGELALMLGLKTTNAIALWRRNNPAIDAMVSRSSAMRLMGRVADVDDALLESATDPSYRNKGDRELFYLRTGIIVPQSKIGVSIETDADKSLLEASSDAELLQLALEQGLVEDEDELDFVVTETEYEVGEGDEFSTDGLSTDGEG